MKKLMMTAAAMTIAGSAFAQCVVNPPTGYDGACALVYNIKLSGKTTMAKYLPYKPEDGLCGLEAGTGDYIYRESTSFRWDGYLVSCYCGCNEFNSGMYLNMWDKKSKSYIFNDGVPLTDVPPGWWMAIDAFGALVPAGNPVLGSLIQWGVLGHSDQAVTGIDEDIGYAGAANGEFINSPYNVYSKKDNKVEAFWSITRAATLPVISRGVVVAGERSISLYAAGQGSLDSKMLLAKNISGNFAGMIGAPYYESSTVCDPSGVLDCSLTIWNDNDSAIYGSWSVQYNSSYSKKLVDERYGHDYPYSKAPNYENKFMRSNDYRYITPTVADICTP